MIRCSASREHCEFSILALGDSNYAQFCQAGKNFDARLEELGAKRVQARVDCEVDYEDNAKLWFEGLMVSLSSTPSEKAGAATPTPNAAVEEKVTPVGFSKKNPFPRATQDESQAQWRRLGQGYTSLRDRPRRLRIDL